MKLAAISDVEFAIHDPKGARWDLCTFVISTEAVSFSALPDSAFSTPARYVAEMFRRLCSLEKRGREAKFIVNPLYATSKLALLLVVARLRALGSPDRLLVLMDKKGRPAGYLLPSWLEESDWRFVTLLSATDGELDAALLQGLFRSPASCIAVPHLGLDRAGHNGFFHDENRAVYEWVARRAMERLGTGVTAETPAQAKREIEAIPFTGVMPYHAGDALFFSIAFNHTRPHISRLVVNKAYEPIVADNAPALSTLAIDLPPANRDGRETALSDHTYFERFRDALPRDGFYSYYRASRLYSVSKFHLIDQFAFALGAPLAARSELLRETRPSPEPTAPGDWPERKRVLLHFDGGWPLKVYPKELQEELIDLLSARGFAVTVLASRMYEHPNCEVTTFRGYAPFVELLRSQHLLVAMDSFPAHYAAHVSGLPTICLFASTRPENSDARPAGNYMRLERGLPCRPCSGSVQCPLYGGSHCRNFVDPQTVATEVARMLDATVGLDVPASSVPLVLSPSPEQRRSPGARRIQHIHIRFLRVKVALASAASMAPGYPVRLYREFRSAVEREGFLLAAIRTKRFVRRILFRR